MDEKLITVGEYNNAMEAEIAKGHLHSSGISSTIVKDDGGGMIPSLQNAEGVQLLVAEEMSEKAAKILQAYSGSG